VILVAGLVLAILSVPLTGGQLRHVLSLRLRSGWLVGAALVCQTIIISVLPSTVPRTIAEAVHLGTYGMAVVFLWRNRHIPWLWLVSIGGGLNLAAIAANHGVMPASRSALIAAGMADESGFANSAVVHHARLAFLGDVFAVPHGFPLANVFSVGDVVLVVGAALLLHRVARPRRPAIARGTGSSSMVVRIETGTSVHRLAGEAKLELHLPGGTVTCDEGTVASMVDDDGTSTIVVIAGNAFVEAAGEQLVLGPLDVVLVSADGRLRDHIRATVAELEGDPWLAAHALDALVPDALAVRG
jgi:hypothetical protein